MGQHDPERAARIRSDIDFLAASPPLPSAWAAAPARSARTPNGPASNVIRAIRTVNQHRARLGTARHEARTVAASPRATPPWGNHFNRARTGAFCSYSGCPNPSTAG